MKYLFALLLLSGPMFLFAQKNKHSYAPKRTYIGINLPPLLLGMGDFKLEHHLSNYIGLQFGAGFRYQDREKRDNSDFPFLKDYIDLRNIGGYIAAGARIFDRTAWEYPYFSFEVGGIYYNEKFYTNFNQNGIPQDTREVKELTWSVAGTIGFVIRLYKKRMDMDLGIQIGYSPYRRDPLTYYHPGLGFTTVGPLSRLSVDGMHIQPVITIKYNLFKDKRDRIREME